MGCFQLDEEQGQAIDEAHQVSASFVEVAGHPQLRGQEEVVAQGLLPVDDAQGRDLLLARVVLHQHAHAFLEQAIDLAVGLGPAHDAAILGQLLDGLVVGVSGQSRVELLQRRTQARMRTTSAVVSRRVNGQ